MKLYVADITCRIRAFARGSHPDQILNFQHAIAGESEAHAKKNLEASFPWTFYKNVNVQWRCIGETS